MTRRLLARPGFGLRLIAGSLLVAGAAFFTACQSTDQSATTSTYERPAGLPDDINDRFLVDEIKADDWINRWEVESREVYRERHLIASWLDLRSGHHIADVGAGTGLFESIFSEHVGPDGRVFAIDISPAFIANLDDRIQREGMFNVETVLTEGDSVGLPPRQVDRAFICDTYHHFEAPLQTMTSLFAAMKPGGILVVVDFERIPGRSRPWILDHVRAGKEVFRQEIEAAGFVLMDEPVVPGLRENYLLRFLRP